MGKYYGKIVSRIIIDVDLKSEMNFQGVHYSRVSNKWGEGTSYFILNFF